MIIAGSLHENKEEAMEEKMIAFPATTEAFIAYQEAGIGRKLEKLERKLASAVVELANISYQEGIEGTENTITMKAVKAFFQSRPNRAASGAQEHLWASICWWCDVAYQAGKEAVQHG